MGLTVLDASDVMHSLEQTLTRLVESPLVPRLVPKLPADHVAPSWSEAVESPAAAVEAQPAQNAGLSQAVQ